MTRSSATGSVGQVRPCTLMDLQTVVDDRGSLSIVEGVKDIGFEIKRFFYLYDLPVKSVRGDHAHRRLEQFVIAVRGSFDVTVDDTSGTSRYHLDNPNQGLYIGPMVWNSLVNFSEGAIALVLASEHYDEADYYRVYEEFTADARLLA
ncbi:FdtA/QdtA family cupin domain-containing protein [Streptomyces sp. NBC_01232]|uniref:sugar 3,4-ketoisomerase n=1 Tax=unclassified Streptomyces TaxID=2593676 RepID=UPI002E1152D9|nr:FdtA/QdtA family cupin domain-containing protein [Streptomyces sp. NBC_01232]